MKRLQLSFLTAVLVIACSTTSVQLANIQHSMTTSASLVISNGTLFNMTTARTVGHHQAMTSGHVDETTTHMTTLHPTPTPRPLVPPHLAHGFSHVVSNNWTAIDGYSFNETTKEEKPTTITAAHYLFSLTTTKMQPHQLQQQHDALHPSSNNSELVFHHNETSANNATGSGSGLSTMRPSTSKTPLSLAGQQLVTTTKPATTAKSPALHQQLQLPAHSTATQTTSIKAVRSLFQDSSDKERNCTQCDASGEWCCPSQSFCAMDQIDLSFNCYRRKHRLVLMNDSCQSCASSDFICCLTIVCTFDWQHNVTCAPIKSPTVNAESLASSVQQSCKRCNSSSNNKNASDNAWCCPNGVTCQDLAGHGFICSNAFSEQAKASQFGSMLEEDQDTSSSEEVQQEGDHFGCPVKCDPEGKWCCGHGHAFCAWNQDKQHYYCYRKNTWGGHGLGSKNQGSRSPKVKRGCDYFNNSNSNHNFFDQSPIFKRAAEE